MVIIVNIRLTLYLLNIIVIVSMLALHYCAKVQPQKDAKNGCRLSFFAEFFKTKLKSDINSRFKRTKFNG